MNTSKIVYLILVFSLLNIGCKESTKKEKNQKSENEVLILGTIHSGHLTDSIYNTAYLDKLIREIKPDYILAEIPPDRFE